MAVLLWVSCGLSIAAEPGSTSAPTSRPARSRVTLNESSPVNGLEEYCRRTRQSAAAFKREGTDHEYTLADESFELFVPPGCSVENPHGLLVWISPGRSDLPRDWFAVLERHKLIWICPNNAGNGRHFLARIGLALDAVHNAKATQPIDPKRIYVSGFSGGGRVASLVALTYPDVVTGAVPMMGVNFYRPLPAGGDNKYFRPGAARPIDPILNQARRVPMVLMTGERDMNQPQTKATFEALQKDRFAQVSYIEVPGIGHDMPAVEWLDKALVTLDAAATAATTRPTTAPRRRKTP
jgi:predicted esterase